MRRALEYATMFGIPVIDHCEDPSLKATVSRMKARRRHARAQGPGRRRGIHHRRAGHLGRGMVGGHVHVAHMSARQSLRAVQTGKDRGIKVTSEVTPHHFVLTDEALRWHGGYDTNTKMNPPLREEVDRVAMLEGIRDGSIDVIATDHAPHHADEKALEFDRAPFGIVGLETAVPLCLDRLVHAGVIGLARFVELLSVNPARVLGLPGGTIAEGSPADLTVLSPDTDVTVHAASLVSKSKNTPFDGWTLKGAVAATIISGRPVFVNKELQEVVRAFAVK
jgi:dihydroorotase